MFAVDSIFSLFECKNKLISNKRKQLPMFCVLSSKYFENKYKKRAKQKMCHVIGLSKVKIQTENDLFVGCNATFFCSFRRVLHGMTYKR